MGRVIRELKRRRWRGRIIGIKLKSTGENEDKLDTFYP